MASKVDICSNASLLVGEDAISALPGNTRAGKVCHNLYDRQRNTLLAMHPWRFAHNQVELARLVDVPAFTTEWAYAYQLPTNFGRLTKIEGGSDYNILADKLLSNQTSVKIEYSFIPDEADFPDWFAVVLEARMAKLLSLAVTDDDTKHLRFVDAERKALVEAKAIDNQSVINKAFDTSILVEVRK